MTTPTKHYAVYGNVVIPREYCRSCGQWALVIQGRLACCTNTTDLGSRRMKRMSEAADVRRQPTAEEKRLILDLQENRCLYCQKRLGSAVIRKGKLTWLRVTWDHLVPFSYGQNNNAINLVAACQICNGIKGSLMFATVEEARAYIVSLSDVQELTETPHAGNLTDERDEKANPLICCRSVSPEELGSRSSY